MFSFLKYSRNKVKLNCILLRPLAKVPVSNIKSMTKSWENIEAFGSLRSPNRTVFGSFYITYFMCNYILIME